MKSQSFNNPEIKNAHASRCERRAGDTITGDVCCIL